MMKFNNEAERARLEADQLAWARHADGNFPNEPGMTMPQPDRMSDAVSVPLPPRIEEKHIAFTSDQASKRLADLTIPHGVKRVILEF